jgi:hypothetical protein
MIRFALTMLMLLADPAFAHEFVLGALEVEHPWARATPGNVRNGAVYMVIENTGTAPDRLVGASTPAAARAEFHLSAASGGIATMTRLDAIEVSPGEPVVLRPGGLHLMLLDLTEKLVTDRTFPLTLTFERSGSVTVEVHVEDAGALESSDAEPGS